MVSGVVPMQILEGKYLHVPLHVQGILQLHSKGKLAELPTVVA
jgi:hypothetical protein